MIVIAPLTRGLTQPLTHDENSLTQLTRACRECGNTIPTGRGIDRYGKPGGTRPFLCSTHCLQARADRKRRATPKHAEYHRSYSRNTIFETTRSIGLALCPQDGKMSRAYVNVMVNRSTGTLTVTKFEFVHLSPRLPWESYSDFKGFCYGRRDVQFPLIQTERVNGHRRLRLPMKVVIVGTPDWIPEFYDRLGGRRGVE